MRKQLSLLNILAVITTIAMSYVSNSGILNGETMGSISAKYQNLFTPAGYAFSIWGLIYLGLLSFVFYFGPFTKKTAFKEQVVQKIGWWFVISCISNSLWVVCWLYEYTLVTIPLMVLVLVSLLKIIVTIQDQNNTSNPTLKLYLEIPFYIYAGWISVALIANVAAYLKKIEWYGFGISESSWAIVMFAIASVIHLFMVWKKNMPAFAMVAVWALIAIAVANYASQKTVYFAALGFALVIFINILIFITRKMSLK